jgi:hypothetical protein
MILRKTAKTIDRMAASLSHSQGVENIRKFSEKDQQLIDYIPGSKQSNVARKCVIMISSREIIHHICIIPSI